MWNTFHTCISYCLSHFLFPWICFGFSIFSIYFFNTYKCLRQPIETVLYVFKVLYKIKTKYVLLSFLSYLWHVLPYLTSKLIRNVCYLNISVRFQTHRIFTTATLSCTLLFLSRLRRNLMFFLKNYKVDIRVRP